ncbi:MAG: type III ribulose-bisphosphate carboxylase [Candidatus Nanoarchaeia archaeon]|nr:type III ribulose-bisphosphate carboxylase [Candidatus Nanoarchaeia archaeon]MDD5357614.1 type III ribulose-bisphosphate carboxylase [Candidatus Nanoarchaeia archaeon]MDD5588533.1 type III ribulose-bisphosphate carboxylase [Candidatus Nanoarchaeia archaeon]
MKKEGLDFLNLRYKPHGRDLVCLFKISPNKMSVEKAANTVALESSVGTWTKVARQKDAGKLKAKVFSIKNNYVKIAYPEELFEKDNVPNMLSSIAGNIFGMKAVRAIRLEDVSFPTAILKSFNGPRYGIEGIRKFMKVKNRPLIGTIIKPKLGLNAEQHSQSAYESWRGGCDIVKDDENLASQKFNEFEKRVVKTLEMADKAESETGEKKAYLVNVTAETKEMIKRAQFVEKQGGKYMMIDILTAGWAAMQTLREANFKLAIHAHRAMHAAFDRNPEHGIDMLVVADFARLIGVDTLHIGTGIGKLEGDVKDIEELQEEIEKMKVEETKKRLEQRWQNIKPVMGVSSGGLHPGHVPFLMKHLGRDLVIQAGGGIHGHPFGTEAGAIAMRQAVDATMKKISLNEYARTHVELEKALELWGK